MAAVPERVIDLTELPEQVSHSFETLEQSRLALLGAIAVFEDARGPATYDMVHTRSRENFGALKELVTDITESTINQHFRPPLVASAIRTEQQRRQSGLYEVTGAERYRLPSITSIAEQAVRKNLTPETIAGALSVFGYILREDIYLLIKKPKPSKALGPYKGLPHGFMAGVF